MRIIYLQPQAFKFMGNIYRFFALIIFCHSNIYGQNTPIENLDLKPVFITETKPGFTSTSRNVTAITNTEMKERGAQTLSDALATLPGVSQLTTGAISKPVIRGLFGNRLQINVAGLRLEDQQWEDEHGLGLSDAGVERVELIKGPAALLFGSDAMGGVVNVVEETVQGNRPFQQNLNLKLFSNTLGLGLDYGFKKQGKNSFLCRVSAENHTDYRAGGGERVPNTRFALYNLKFGHIYQGKNLRSENRLLTSYSAFGFLTDSAQVQNKSDLGRDFKDGPHHSVLLAILSSRNTVHLNEHATLLFTLGYQTNLRQEQERGNRTDLNLNLNTGSLNASIQQNLPHNWLWTNGFATLVQRNTNNGGRIIVPDASILEGAVFSYIKRLMQSEKYTGAFEAGVRYDRRQINTLRTRDFNTASSLIPPFSKPFDDFNGAIGQSLQFGHWAFKADASTGFRAANLAELAANGLHEGTPNWYLGNPNMKVEQCLNLDVSGTWQLKNFSARGSVFSNRFFNYIYLTPTGTEYFGFPLYRYLQDNAVFKGFETGISWEQAARLSLSLDYSYLSARRDDHQYLPFIPANRLIFNGKYFIPLPERFAMKQFYAAFGMQYVGAQNNPAQYETATADYALFNAGLGVQFHSMRILLSGRNITDRRYVDHLSRLKYLGAYDMGRNIVLNLGWQF
jgi:iron complex outermembrane receptor protein